MERVTTINKKNLLISVIGLCFLICWVASLPKRAIIFPNMTTPNVRILNALVFSFASVSGVIVGRLCSKKFLKPKLMLIFSGFLCLTGTVFVYSFAPEFQFVLSLITFLFFGFCLALLSQLMLCESTRRTRIWAVGAIVFTRVLLSFLGGAKLSGLASIPTIFISFSCIAIVIISTLFLRGDRSFEITNVNPASNFKKTKSSFLFLIIYYIVLLFSKGILLQELTHSANYNPLYFSIGMITSYALALFLIVWHSKSPHLRSIVYIANSLAIIAIVINLLSDNSSWMLILIYSLIYFSFSVNEVFCFDTFFEFGELFGSGSLVFGIAFTSGSLAQLGGVLFFEFNDQAQVLSADLVVVILFALLTLVLPSFLIELSKVSAFSVFRISLIQYYQGANQLSPAETSMQDQEAVEHDNGSKSFTAPDVLTDREKEVLELVLKGLPSKLIVAELFISINTLKSHIQSIYSKLNVHNRSELFLLLKKDQK